MKIDWCVCSGPDESHLWDVAWFTRLRDAKAHAESLPVTPFGDRPYKIERHERSDYETEWNKRVVFDSRRKK